MAAHQTQHPGWIGTAVVPERHLREGGSVPQSVIDEAATEAMQAWADDPQCRWWLPGDTFDVSVESGSDLMVSGAVTVRVHIPARFVRWLAPKGEHE